MNEKKLTPMMQQYLAVKQAHPDCLVFFRLGDFYEMFMDDARVGARELDLTLTTRDRNKPPEEQTPMCGVPHHAVQGYISKLTAKGYKVVICEQMEDPATAQGLVDRDITRIVTPGTVVEGEGLTEDRNNYLCGVYLEKPLSQPDNWAGLAFCDLSTGETEAVAVKLPQDLPRVFSELESRMPREVICSQTAWAELQKELAARLNCHMEQGDETAFDWERGYAMIHAQFRRQQGALKPQEGEHPAVAAVGGLLRYLYDTQRVEKLPHLHTISFYWKWTYMELDRATRRNLELTETLREKDRRGSLLWTVDRCKTPMGRRKLRGWMERPLISAFEINERQKGVAALVKDTTVREELRRLLSQTGDLDRVLSRLGCGGGGARELLSLEQAMRPVAQIMDLLAGFKTPVFQEQLGQMDALDPLMETVRSAINHIGELPTTVREGGIIARGYDPEVDRFRDLLESSGNTLLDMENRERTRTGIKTLRIKFNKVFGYSIEIPNTYKDQVPPEYIRRQTLVGGERYITAELKQLEEDILTARERGSAREYEIFCTLRDQVVAQSRAIQATADALATVDVLAGFAALAVEQRYVRPKVDKSGVLEIENGRHPVVERTLTEGPFVPNDTHMDPAHTTLALITGPNMAGKSTYMRQVGLIVLLAQMGSYVPATKAHIGVVDRVFTRIGASDDLTSGQSTFMVEMSEVAEILKHATPKSLILLDEIGRGTSTYDGMSIARGVLEYCATTVQAKTLFATHYHELCRVADSLPQVKNYNIAAEKRGDKVVFLRKILPGGADESYGIEVARLAGVPEPVLARAAEVLAWAEQAVPEETARRLEHRAAEAARARQEEAARTPTAVERELLKCDPNAMTPLEALTLVSRLLALLRQEGKV